MGVAVSNLEVALKSISNQFSPESYVNMAASSCQLRIPDHKNSCFWYHVSGQILLFLDPLLLCRPLSPADIENVFTKNMDTKA